MPATTLDFRAICGTFVAVFINFMWKRALRIVAMRVRSLRLEHRSTGVIVGFLLSLLYFGDLLYRCGDVEVNPGPRGDTLRQTRLTTGGRNSSNDRGDKAMDTSSHQSADERSEPTLKDVMQTLMGMDSKFDALKEDFRQIKDCYVGLKEEVSGLRSEMADLKSENDELRDENRRLQTKMEEIERKTDDLEDRSKRNNIIIHGISRDKNEKGHDCEELVREMIVDKLELTGDFEFDRVHRVNSKENSPIVARCTFYKDKVSILKAKKKLKGSTVFIGEDFSRRVREVRKKLSPHLKTAKTQGKRATMVFDHLLIEGKKYGLGDDGNLKEIP